MPILQSIEMNCQLSDIYFKFMLDDFSNFVSSIFVLFFAPGCCYFIINIFLSGLPLIY